MRMLLSLLAAISLVLMPSAATAGDPMKVGGAGAFKGAGEVVIGTFVVAFLVEKKDKLKLSGGGAHNAKVLLKGVGPEDFQAVTDAAYQAFADKLTAQGYTVRDHKGFEDVVAAKAIQYDNGEARGLFMGKGAKAQAVYYAPTDHPAGPYATRDFSAAVVNGGFSRIRNALNLETAMKAYAKENGVTVVNVMLVLDYADIEKYKSVFGSYRSITTSTSLAVVSDYSQLVVYSPSGSVGTVTLKQSVAMPGAFGTLENSTSSGQKVGNAVAGAIGILGGVGSFSSSQMTYSADAPEWRKGAIAVTGDASGQMIGRMTALR